MKAKLRAYLDTEHPQFLERVLLAHLVVVLGALLFAAVIGACSNDGFATMGQIGDVLGGVSNFVVSFVVVLSAAYATRQFKKFREEHSHETKASVALRTYRATYKFNLVVQRCLKFAREGKPVLDEGTLNEIDASVDAIAEAAAEANLVLYKEVAVRDVIEWLLVALTIVRLRPRQETKPSDRELRELDSVGQWSTDLLTYVRDVLAKYMD